MDRNVRAVTLDRYAVLPVLLALQSSLCVAAVQTDLTIACFQQEVIIILIPSQFKPDITIIILHIQILDCQLTETYITVVSDRKSVV